MSNSPTTSLMPRYDGPIVVGPLLFSAADALSADLTAAGVTTYVGPVASVSGDAPPAYDNTRHLHHLLKTVDLNPASVFHPTLLLNENDIETVAASNGISIDTESSHGEANIDSSVFLLSDNPWPLDIASVLGLSMLATDIHASADFSHVFGFSRNFVTGDASFGSLSIGGSLIGRTLTFSGDAAPNTVLFSSPTITVTLDKQIVTDLISIGTNLTVTPVSITTEAIDISLHNASFVGTHISGDIVVGQASAGILFPPSPLQHPSPLA